MIHLSDFFVGYNGRKKRGRFVNVRIWRHHREDHGGLIRTAFVRRGADVTEELVGAASEPSSLRDVDVLVVLGSSESVYDTNVPWLRREMDAMMSAIESGTRVLGICFGAQMLCVAHGGIVERAGAGELGWVDVESLVEGLSSGPWFQYHNDHCIVPEGAVIIASNAAAVQAFGIGRHLGVQFHPEVDAEQLTDWFANDADAHRSGADIDGFISFARGAEQNLVQQADRLVGHFLGELN